MSNHFKRVLAILLALVMVIGLLPTIAFAAEDKAIPAADESAEVVTPEHEAELQADVLGDIGSYFNRQHKRSVSSSDAIELKDFYDAAEDIKQIVLSSDTYVEDSLLENGDGFYWETTTGITCGYFPQHEYEMAVMRANNANSDGTKNASASACTNYSSSAAGDDDVCVIGPLYSEDDTFTEQYGNEAKAIANELGGTAYKLINSNASITNIADAISKCRVVIFDSHGNTDWGYFGGGSDGEGEADCVTKANTSYLCLSTGSGITRADMTPITSPSGHYSDEEIGGYCHAYSDSYGNYVIDGTAIANHMTKDAPNSLLWMAICLGMATDGLAAPLHNKGVSVVYGYSQSVSFDGEYAYEEDFWDRMIAGDTVASAISYMKKQNGNWDPEYKNYTLSKARSEYVAFPIVVSDEDTYPGQRTSTTNYDGTVDAVQTVRSTWKLKEDLPKDPCTITLMAGTSVFDTIETTTNATALLPTYTGTVPTGYTFAGWTASTISGTTQSAPTLYNGSYTTGSATAVNLYACFSKTEGGSGGTGKWTLLENASTLSSGMKVVFASESQGYTAGDISSEYMTKVESTFSSDGKTITSLGSDTVQMTVGGSSGAWTFANTSGKLLGATAVKKLAWGGGKTTWSVSVSGGSATIQNGTESYGKFLYNVNSPRFTTYTSAASTTMLLPEIYYMDGTAGTTTYTTTIATCSHSGMQTIAAQAATCTATGNNTYYYCPSCTTYFADIQGKNPTTVAAQTIPMVDHTYGAWTSNNNKTHTKECSVCHNKVTENCTFTSAVSGATVTFTCSACHYSYQETKPTYTVSYNVLGSVVNTASCVEGESVTLPATETAVDGYDFAGWVKNAISEETSTAPTVLTGSYKPTASITLYAVYTRTEAGTGTGSSNEFMKVTTAPSDWSGDYLIVYEDSATEATVFSDTSAYTTGTISNGKITKADGMAVVKIASMTGGYSLYVDGKGYMKGTSGSNALSYETTAQKNTIAKDTDGIKITSNTSVLRWNDGSSIFRYYKSSSYANQKPIQLYKAGAGSSTTTYYTTAPTVTTACDHANMQPVAAVEPKCEAAGNNLYYHCPDCGKYFKDAAGSTVTTVEAEVVAALGHDYNGTVAQKDATYHTVQCTRCDSTTDMEHTFAAPVISGTTASRTCSVCEYSEPVTAYTVTFCASSLAADAESPLSAQTVVAGGKVTAPTPAAKEGFTFLGWYTQSGSWTSDPGILTSAQINAAAVNADCTYYGVWAEGDTNPTVFTKATELSELTDGTQVIIVSNYNDKAITTTAGAADVTVTDNTVPATAGNIWTIEKSGSTYKFKANNKYLTLSSKTVSVGTSGTSFTVVKSDNTNYPDSFWIRDNSNYYLEYNNGWVGYNLSYAPTTSGAAGYVSNDLYISKTVISEYTTSPAVCAHPNMEPVAAVAPKCEAAGNNLYYHCPDCGKDFKDAAGNTTTTVEAETVTALGHDYTGTVTQKDAVYHSVKCTRCDSTQDQEHTFAAPVISGTTASHTCSICNYSEPVTAYTVSYSVPAGIAAVPAETVAAGGSVTLPTAGEVEGYTFAGWVKNVINDETTTAPTVLTDPYTPTADVTLHALYTRIEEGDGVEPGYYLATETPAIGDRIIIAIKDGDDWYALPNGNTKGAESISGESLTVTNDCAVDNEDITFEVIENKSDTGIKSTTGDYYLGLNSGKLAMNGWGDTKVIAFTAGTEAGTYYIIGAKSGTQGNEGRALDYDGSSFICDNDNGGSPVYIFTYTEGGAGSTTYYTTAPVVETPCTHESTTLTGYVEATCGAAGYTGDYVCDDCGETVTTGTAIAALGHDLTAGAIIAPTCTTPGYTEYNCSSCDYSENKDETDPLGHDLAWDGVVGNGITHGLACDRCDYTESEACDTNGTDGACSICGYSEAAEVVVKVSSAALRLGENIDLIYTASVPEDATNVYMTFTMNGETVTVEDDGTHTFAYTAINPQCMGDNVAAILYATVSGTEYTDEIATYSVRQYCINKLADSSVTGTLRTLISDVLAYGAAAQTYMSYNTSALVNEGSDIKNPTYSTFSAISGFAPSFNGTAANDVRWVGAGLALTNNVAMTFRFYAESVDGLSVTVAINGREETFTEFTALGNDLYELSFTGIKANEFADSVTASFARNGASIGNSVSYSVNSYVCAKQADSDANLAALVKALYNYGAAAKSYIPA